MQTVRDVLTKFKFSAETDKLDGIESRLESIKQRLGFLAGVELAKAVYELGERFAAFGENLHVAAESAGLTVEAFQKLTFSAKQSAVSQEEMETSMVRLSRTLYQAKIGGADAQKAFALVGITPQQVQGFKTSRDALLALSDRFKNINDPIQKAALAQQLLGRGSVHMVGYLSQGSAAIKAQGDEAQRLGIVLSTKQVDALVKLEHELQKLWALFQAIGASIAAKFAPALGSMIESVLKLVAANRQLIEVNLEKFVYNFSFALGFVWGLVEDGIYLMTELAKKFHLEGDILPILGTIAGLTGGLLTLVKAGKLVAGIFGEIKSVVTLLTSPFIVAAASLGLIVASVHDLKEELAGHTDNLWLDKIAKTFGYKGSAVGGASDYASDLFLNMGKAFHLGAGSPTNTNTSNVHAPITVIVPPGSNPDHAARGAQAGVKEHLDGVMRAARVGVQTGVQY